MENMEEVCFNMKIAEDSEFVLDSGRKGKPLKFHEQRGDVIALALLKDKADSVILDALKSRQLVCRNAV